MKRAGFTLIEMLVVMAIIGILAGLMFPALGAVRKKAYATQSHELVTQVQSAWLVHLNDFRSFPDPKLFDKPMSGGEDDIIIAMSPRNLCLLNWRCVRPTNYLGDTEDWEKALSKTIDQVVSDSKNADNKPHSASIEGKNKSGKKTSFTISTRDAYFEIDQLQWICGVLNVWGSRKAQVLYKNDGASAAASVAEVLVSEKFADPRVYAKLDTGYDGKVTPPVSTTTSHADILNVSAAAWVGGASPKDDSIVSW